MYVERNKGREKVHLWKFIYSVPLLPTFNVLAPLNNENKNILEFKFSFCQNLQNRLKTSAICIYTGSSWVICIRRLLFFSVLVRRFFFCYFKSNYRDFLTSNAQTVMNFAGWKGSFIFTEMEQYANCVNVELFVP